MANRAIVTDVWILISNFVIQGESRVTRTRNRCPIKVLSVISICALLSILAFNRQNLLVVFRAMNSTFPQTISPSIFPDVEQCNTLVQGVALDARSRLSSPLMRGF